MNVQTAVILPLMVFYLQHQQANCESSVGTVFVKFEFYRQSDRSTCDTVVWGADYCDPYFIIAAASSVSKRMLDSFTSTEYDNAPTVIQFGTKIGANLQNPLTFKIPASFFAPDDGLLVSVAVKDKDPHDVDDRMVNFQLDARLTDVATLFANNSFQMGSDTYTTLTNRGHQLKLAVWIQCAQNYYRSGCSAFCDSDRVKCSPTGDPICPTGHMAWNGICISAYNCLEPIGGPNSCQNNGTCVKTADGNSTCQCPLQFTGPQCQLETHACHWNATWCAQGVCRANSSQSKSSECVCNSGFTGYHCDEDVDECREGAPCGEGGQCVNSLGSYRCVCAPGFFGERCQQRVETPTSTAVAVTRESSEGSASGSVTGSQIHSATISTLLVALLALLICGCVAALGFYVHQLKLQQRALISAANHAVVFRSIGENPSVSIQQSQVGNDIDSPYYEEIIANEGVAASATDGVPSGQTNTDNASNPAYTPLPSPTNAGLTLTLTSKSRSYKTKLAASQQAVKPVLPPRDQPTPSNSNPPPVRKSTLGLGEYLEPVKKTES